MSIREQYEQKAEAMAEPIVTGHGFELVDVEYVKEAGTWYLRLYIDKEGGITIDDCETVINWMRKILFRMLILWKSVLRGWADH